VRRAESRRAYGTWSHDERAGSHPEPIRMTQLTLLTSAALSFIAAAVYAYVGLRLSRRQVSQPSALAWKLFVVWWAGIAATTTLGGVQTLLGLAGALTPGLLLGIGVVNDILISIALWGLLYYLLYLFTGRRALLWPLSAIYIAFFALIVEFIGTTPAFGVKTNGWTFSANYGQSSAALLANPVIQLIIVMLLVPQIIGALAYFSLYFRLQDPTRRYRVFVVSWAIILWFGSPFIALGAGLSTDTQTLVGDAYQLASRLIGLGAAIAILMAYLPPPSLRRRYGLHAVDETPLASGSDATTTELAPRPAGRARLPSLA
jgi:hypothetical protein